MKKTFTLLMAIFTFQSFAQQGDGWKKTYKASVNLKEINKVTFQEPNIEALKAEDALVDGTGTAPWRFGWNNYTNLNTSNAGTWTTLPNGDRLWQLLIECENAQTINVNTENLNAGIYMYQVKVGNNVTTGKISKR